MYEPNTLPDYAPNYKTNTRAAVESGLIFAICFCAIMVVAYCLHIAYAPDHIGELINKVHTPYVHGWDI